MACRHCRQQLHPLRHSAGPSSPCPAPDQPPAHVHLCGQQVVGGLCGDAAGGAIPAVLASCLRGQTCASPDCAPPCSPNASWEGNNSSHTEGGAVLAVRGEVEAELGGGLAHRETARSPASLPGPAETKEMERPDDFSRL